MSFGVAAAVGGGLILGSMMNSKTPDTSGMNQAAVDNAKLGQEQLDWYKQIYAEQAPIRQQAIDAAQKVSDAQLAAMKTATDQAQKDQEYRETVFQPLEKGIVNDAEAYDTEGNRERLAGLALGDVRQNFATSGDIATRNMERIGVNPNDGSFGATNNERAIAEAAAGAGAATKARQDALTLGHAMKMDAASLGRGLPSSQATQAGLAINSGNSAVGNSQVPLNVTTQGANMVGAGYTGAVNANNSAANIYGQIGNIQNNSGQQNNALYGAAGQAFGAYMASDKNIKEKKRPMKGEIALAIVNKMPVQKWRYKPDSYAADGGKDHIGPMAQDVRKAAGESAAPGGKVVNLGDIAGVTLAAVQQLDKKVERLAKSR
jgi:hypothetical protein